MKILRVITRLPPGGIERRMAALLPKLKERGVEPEVCCVHEKAGLAHDLEAAGIPVHLRKLKTRLHPAGVRALADLIAEGGFDLVHSHMYRSNAPATIAAKLAGRVPILCQIHNVGTWETRRQLWLDRFLCRWRAGMAAPGERVAAEIREKLRLPADRVHVIHNGVDTTLFSPDAGRRWKLRRELDLPDDALAFLCPARLHPQKNHAGLLRAFRAAKLPPKCRLLLAGNGNERASLEALAAELDLLESKARVDAPFVQFLGHRDDMADLYRAADAMILPSFKEGFSNAVVEGMASGLPVVATDVGGNSEALGEAGEFGVVAKTFETAELAAAIELVAADRERRERMGAGGRERAARLFSLDAMADATVRLYERLLAEEGAKKGGAANEAAKGASRG